MNFEAPQGKSPADQVREKLSTYDDGRLNKVATNTESHGDMDTAVPGETASISPEDRAAIAQEIIDSRKA